MTRLWISVSGLMTFLMLTQVQLFVAVGVGRYKNHVAASTSDESLDYI
jgi:hypothetical protein